MADIWVAEAQDRLPEVFKSVTSAAEPKADRDVKFPDAGECAQSGQGSTA
jgi:hypothetical protein